MTNSKIFAVCGMHASGTSAVAKWLHDSGVDMGDNLIGSNAINIHGHYEDIDFVSTHKKILTKNNIHPSGLDSTFHMKDWEGLECNFHKKESNHAWGWKDPRTTLFIKQYHKINPDIHFIFVIRKPELVIASLLNRIKTYNWDEYLLNKKGINKLSHRLFSLNNTEHWKIVFESSYNFYYQSMISSYQYAKNVSIIDFERLKNQEYDKLSDELGINLIKFDFGMNSSKKDNYFIQEESTQELRKPYSELLMHA